MVKRAAIECRPPPRAEILRSSTLMIREKRRIRSKKSARLWYLPLIEMLIGQTL